MKKALLVFVLVTLCASGSQAFDGQRKGFVLGAGVGMSPFSITDLKESSYSKTGTGVAFNLIMGGGLDENNIIGFESNMSFGKKGSFNVYQGFNGFSWYHYNGPSQTGYYTNMGFGFYVVGGDFRFSNGIGGILGVGVISNKHMQMGLSLSFGRTILSHYDFGCAQINLVFTGLAF